MNTCQQSFRQP